MRKLLIILAFIFAMPALCFGGKLRIEETVFDSHSSTTTQTTRCELPKITGVVKDMTTAFIPNYTPIPNAKITYQPIETNNKITDIRNRKIIYSDSEGLFELCDLMFNGSSICKYLVTARSTGYGWAKEIIEFPSLNFYGNSVERDVYFAFDVSLGLWPKWTKQRHKAYIQGVLYLKFYDPVEGFEDYKTLSDVEIKVKGLKTKYKASIISEYGEFETDYLKADTYILTLTYDGKTYRKKIILPKSTTYNYIWVIEQE